MLFSILAIVVDSVFLLSIQVFHVCLVAWSTCNLGLLSCVVCMSMCCLVVASLASWSALSFPRSPTCAGIHRRWIRWPGRSSTQRIRGTRAVAEMDGGWGLDRARSPDFESVNMVALLMCLRWISVMACWIATSSPTKEGVRSLSLYWRENLVE